MAVIDRGWSWVVSAACFVNMLCVIGLYRASGVIYSAIIDTFGVTREEATWPFSLAGTIGLLVSVCNGILCQLFTIRTIAISATLVSSIGLALCFTAHEVLPLTIYLGFIYGFGIGIINVSCLIITCQYFKKYKTIAIGVLYAGTATGSFILPPLIEYLLKIYGLRGTFLILSGICLQGMVAAALYRPQELDDAKPNKCEEKLKFASKPAQIISKWVIIFRFRIFYLIWITYAVYHFTYFIFPTVIVDYASDLNIKTNKGVFLLSGYCIGDLCGRLSCGWATDVLRIKKKYVIIASFLLQAVILLITPFYNSYIFLMFVSAGVGYFTGCLMPQWPVIFADYLGLTHLPFAIGTVLTLTGFLPFCFPYIIGYYRDIKGSYSSLYFTCAGINLLAVLLWSLEHLFVDRPINSPS
ncbi:monocarboxylate transporter 12-B-like isoform X2 [Centruroides sculpturatus]|uniref:monocarboxylate transporter 12-B-like isoform X2 n=1 Tax=Centruroides sculpturatus TaxID=218467 RepID=UPI000C6CC701|nr:monocarboxylate transporter 12-B-like isoform X2 [Centruroides sculpturatus]